MHIYAEDWQGRSETAKAAWNAEDSTTYFEYVELYEQDGDPSGPAEGRSSEPAAIQCKRTSPRVKARKERQDSVW